MIDTAPKMLDIKYFSRCLNKTGELLERNECGGLRVGNVIEFEVVLKVRELIPLLVKKLYQLERSNNVPDWWFDCRLWNVLKIQRIGTKL